MNIISATDAFKKSNINIKIKILEYKKIITKNIADSITQAIKNGELKTEVILQKYWNFRLENNCFKFDNVIKELVKELKSQNYDVYYGPNKVYHDTTVQYMNSGGECGSSDPYYTDVLSLCIKWNKK